MQTRPVVLRNRCDYSGNATRRRRFLIGATAGGESSNLRRPHVVRLPGGCALLVAVVSALAFSVTAYAAPPDRAAEGKGQVRSESSRLLTGDQALLRDAVDGANAVAPWYAVLRPVAAQGTQIYPPGTIVDTANATITIPANNPLTKIFFEGLIGDWGDGTTNGDQTLKNTQLTLDSSSFNSSSAGGCALTNGNNPAQFCNTDLDCETSYGPGVSPSQCTANNCDDSWQDSSRADYCLAGQPTISACSMASPDRSCAIASLGGCNPDLGTECYNNHFLVSVPSCAKGTYTLTLVPSVSLIQMCDGSIPPLVNLSRSILSPARIIIPTGSCCFAMGTSGAGCVDEVTLGECNARLAPRSFNAGQACPPECRPPVSCADCCGGRPGFVDNIPPPNGPFVSGGTVAVGTYLPAPPGIDSVVAVYDLGHYPVDDPSQAPINTNWSGYHSIFSHPSWSQAILGNVFGLTLDHAGNIYVASTSIYGGNNLGTLGFAVGGKIYKIDTATGAATLFGTPLPNTLTSPGGVFPNLGDICYDCRCQQFYVSNFSDGGIYRLGANGAILSCYDHATDTVFLGNCPDSDPDAFAPLGQRPWAVKAHDGRLYYSQWVEDRGFGRQNSNRGNEVWSVEIDPATCEFHRRTPGQLPDINMADYPYPEPFPFTSIPYSNPISDIAFGPNCCMMIAERTMESDTGTRAHNARALEFCPPNWTQSGNLFQIGVLLGSPFVSATNSAGGTDYDFAPGGRDWFTGDVLHYGNPDFIYGLQGTPSHGGGNSSSILIDLDGDTTTSPEDKNHLGDVEISCPSPRDGAIPTVSEWGLVVLALLLLAGAKVYFTRRRTATAC